MEGLDQNLIKSYIQQNNMGRKSKEKILKKSVQIIICCKFFVESFQCRSDGFLGSPQNHC
jgi:hypothetical protein